jgi:hypothetical protein
MSVANIYFFFFYRGGHAPSYLYRIVSDHYRKEDISF